MSKNNHILIIAADGYEDLEFTASFDILQRWGFNIDVAYLLQKDKDHVTSACGLNIIVKETLNSIIPKLDNYDYLMIPGGDGNVTRLDNSEDTSKILAHFISKNKKIAAICAAPTLLAKRGYLKGKYAICYPNKKYQSILIANGAKIKNLNCKAEQDCSTIIDGNIITGLDFRTAVKFADNLVKFFN
ncbi:MAG: thiazole biosynthesis protein ThiJ [Candidatus Hepatoplasma scabrum]|nr:MAG: thiazole biosynthesis protein ThiJ [Candidatus Hepatoplasma sp.]